MKSYATTICLSASMFLSNNIQRTISPTFTDMKGDMLTRLRVATKFRNSLPNETESTPKCQIENLQMGFGLNDEPDVIDDSAAETLNVLNGTWTPTPGGEYLVLGLINRATNTYSLSISESALVQAFLSSNLWKYFLIGYPVPLSQMIEILKNTVKNNFAITIATLTQLIFNDAPPQLINFQHGIILLPGKSSGGMGRPWENREFDNADLSVKTLLKSRQIDDKIATIEAVLGTTPNSFVTVNPHGCGIVPHTFQSSSSTLNLRGVRSFFFLGWTKGHRSRIGDLVDQRRNADYSNQTLNQIYATENIIMNNLHSSEKMPDVKAPDKPPRSPPLDTVSSRQVPDQKGAWNPSAINPTKSPSIDRTTKPRIASRHGRLSITDTEINGPGNYDGMHQKLLPQKTRSDPRANGPNPNQTYTEFDRNLKKRSHSTNASYSPVKLTFTTANGSRGSFPQEDRYNQGYSSDRSSDGFGNIQSNKKAQ